jgi:transposase-like protein
MQAQVAEDIRTIFNAPDKTTAQAYLAKAVVKYQKVASRLSEWMAANIPEGLTVFSFPSAHRTQIRTTNMVERLHREVRRRARVVSIFPNPASCLRLVSAVLSEISDEWLAGNACFLSKGST